MLTQSPCVPITPGGPKLHGVSGHAWKIQALRRFHDRRLRLPRGRWARLVTPVIPTAPGRAPKAELALPLFRVQLYNSGQWDGNPSHEIQAEDSLSAAEHVAGEQLSASGVVGNFRASVWYADQPHIPGERFYRMPDE
jgi:hypothetical protein